MLKLELVTVFLDSKKACLDMELSFYISFPLLNIYWAAPGKNSESLYFFTQSNNSIFKSILLLLHDSTWAQHTPQFLE